MGAYVLAVVNKTDVAKYQQYAEAGFHSIQSFEPQVTVAEAPEVLEGAFPGTTAILLKFKDMDDAKAWYNCDLYQAAIPLRRAAGETAFVIIFPSAD
jgi:uncharacterized protein (DUF1330 family)